MNELLWDWEFCDVPLRELKDNDFYYNGFKIWLVKEEEKAISTYPPSQLKAMRQLVEKEEQDN